VRETWNAAPDREHRENANVKTNEAIRKYGISGDSSKDILLLCMTFSEMKVDNTRVSNSAMVCRLMYNDDVVIVVVVVVRRRRRRVARGSDTETLLTRAVVA
jgi:hypothetical protein